MMERRWVPPPQLLLLLLLLGLPDSGRGTSELELGGRHVCTTEDSLPPVLVCCPGWKQVGSECPLALCLGADACQEREICVRPAVCRCRPGFFGANCSARCPEQFWGPDCKQNCHCHPHGRCHPANGECSCHLGCCGHCRNREPCSPTEGDCLACDPGWNGTRCWQPCPPGLYGDNCTQPCPRHCLQGETCLPQTGQCQNCEAGFMGSRCEASCPPGFFGEGCRSSCPDCFFGSCDPASGTCLCQPGYWGTSCNQSCPEAFHGPNCSVVCPCAGGPCHPVSGDCPWEIQGQEALLAGILGPLLLLLGLCCCCCCCHHRCRGAASLVRAPGAERDLFPPAKHHLIAGLPGLPSSLPCFSPGGSKLPRVTVAHRDLEVPFSPSFIEPTSTAWPSDSSFGSSEGVNEEMGGCQGSQSALPPSEALPEGSILLGAAALHSSPFAIPRTSSIAKGKRPSVSFAEGTHFGPQSPRALPEALNPARKPTASKSSVQGPPPLQLLLNRPTGASWHSLGKSCYENVAPAAWEDSGWAPEGHHPGSCRSWAGGSQHLVQRAEHPEADAVEACVHESSITTIYMTVGQAGRFSKDPPLAVQWHQSSGQEEAAWPRSLQKVPWKALDAAKGTSRKLAAEKQPSTAEAQGLLAPDKQAEGGGSRGTLEPRPLPGGAQPVKQTCPASEFA
ncbi:scavenger receptor class F member 1 isoform X1 [Ahaetulla prasina]|uniref:scavenger receptor class F member 1 isoform X1 n=1 Tax=Ahaetulla prasina TaxID=499056 RepID=UPI0026494E65|nr:scavenger receptor class F member 1 isoform X1 [Ahaetulla prasina]